MYVFTASRISANHNFLFPDRIEIDDVRIMYHKGALFGGQTIAIERNKIASVQVIQGIIWDEIIIESYGGRSVVVEGLSQTDSQKIEELLRV